MRYANQQNTAPESITATLIQDLRQVAAETNDAALARALKAALSGPLRAQRVASIALDATDAIDRKRLLAIHARVQAAINSDGFLVTDWLDGTIPPARVGPYERRRKADGKWIGYSMWSGQGWGYGRPTPADAESITTASDKQVDSGATFEWRGISEDEARAWRLL